MRTRGNFGHNPAEVFMQVVLPVNDGRKHLGHAIGLAHDGGGCIIAAAFDPEDGERFGHNRSGCVWLLRR